MATKGKVRSPAAVIVFSIITCGIYSLVWIYNFSKELNIYLGKESMNPALELILCIVCFPYVIYWSYKYGKLVSEAQKRAKQPLEDNSLLYLVLAIFGFFIINIAIMQSTMNKIWGEEPA